MKTGKIHLKREDISKKIGELFLQRCYVNLHTDILDTPGRPGQEGREAHSDAMHLSPCWLARWPSADIFWEFDEFEGTYS